LKTLALILAASFMFLILGCNRQPADKEQTKTIQDKDTVLSSNKKSESSAKIITDTLPSDIDKINFVIIYNPFHDKDYTAEHESSISVTDKYATDRDVDKGQIHFPCNKKRLHDYKISKEKIVNIISLKYDMTVYDKTDYVFTKDTIFEIHTSTANAGIFTDSDIKFIPNTIDLSSEIKYPRQDNKSCNLNDYLFNLVLSFCKKNSIKIQ